MCADTERVGEGEPSAMAVDLPLEDFSFSARFFLVFFLGRSHSQRGMKDSTYSTVSNAR